MKTENNDRENKENDDSIKGLYSNVKQVIIETGYSYIVIDCKDQINFGFSGIAIQTKNIKMAIPLRKIISSKLENNNTRLILELTSI